MRSVLSLFVSVCLLSVAVAAEPASALDRLNGQGVASLKDFKAPPELVAVLGKATEPPRELWHRIAFSREGTWLAAGRGAGVRIWNLKQPELQEMGIESRRFVGSLAISPDGKALACGTSGEITVWALSADKPRPVATLESDPQDYVLGLTFLDNARLVAASSHRRTLRFWDVSDSKPKLTATVIHQEAKEGDRIYGLAASADSKMLVSGQRYGSLAIWDPTGAGPKQQLPARGGHAVAIAPDGKCIATGDRGGLQVWDLGGGKPVPRSGGGGWLNGAAFSPDGKLLASADRGGLIQVLDRATLKPVLGWKLPDPVHDVDFAPDGRYLAAVANNTLVYVFRLPAAAQAGR